MGAYPTPPGPGMALIADAFKDQKRQTREGQRPGGTNIAKVVQRVETLVLEVKATLQNIYGMVAEAIAAQSMTTAQINQKVASPGDIAPGNVAATGNMSAGGSLSVGGALRAPSVPTTILTSSYFATYATTVDGTLGHVPSSAQFKRDMRPTALDPLTILNAEIVDFRYKAEVELHGDDAPFIIGGIAEQFHAAGLGAFVSYDENGDPFGIAYERLALGVIPLLQQLNARVAELEARN